jgi:enamine deaminase RidA (YjgF/YER057c/UK114 family)
MNVYEHLEKMNVTLPIPPVKGGVYKPVTQVGTLLYISGQGCTENGIPIMQGKVGDDCTVEMGQKAAKQCAINALALLEQYLGDLHKVKRLVKTLVFVNSTSQFSQQHIVANGCSQFLADVFGEDAGVGSRSAIGVAQLPGNIPVEVEFIFETV